MSISDSDYEGRFTIPTPKGIYQAAGDTNINADYAYRAQNIRTERGRGRDLHLHAGNRGLGQAVGGIQERRMEQRHL